MVRKLVLCLALLAIVVTVGCNNDNGSGGVGGVKASIDINNITRVDMWNYGGPSGTYGFLVPVIVTPTGVPSANVLYSVELLSREGYRFGGDVVGWSQGAAPTPRRMEFVISFIHTDASHVYAQFSADYQSQDFSALRGHASALLCTSIKKLI